MNMIIVEFGNADAVEPKGDPKTSQIDYQPMEGERVTKVLIPEGTSLRTSFVMALGALESWTTVGARPVWVRSNSQGLQALLEEHFGIAPGTEKPRDWGTRKIEETPA